MWLGWIDLSNRWALVWLGWIDLSNRRAPGLGAKVTSGTREEHCQKIRKPRQEDTHWYAISLGPAPLDRV